MPTVLALSPHLDDAAFSCGGLLVQLADAGWRTVVATVFTRSVPNPQGFALACQTDKGLPPGLDYMALRRAEDRAAITILGAEHRYLDFAEAPHRGYHSAPALFGPMLDDAWRTIAPAIAALMQELDPALVLLPSGMGAHVDHRHVIQAAVPLAGGQAAFYRDAPYAIRNPAAPLHVITTGLCRVEVGIAAGLDRKVRASVAYTSQLGFQFGGPDAAAVVLRQFAQDEGGGLAAEIYYAPAGLIPGGHERATL